MNIISNISQSHIGQQSDNRYLCSMELRVDVERRIDLFCGYKCTTDFLVDRIIDASSLLV